jgi:hypothetical protein
MAEHRHIDFLQHADTRKCRSRNVAHMLRQGAVRKSKDIPHGTTKWENLLITREGLDKALRGKVKQYLRCTSCSVCKDATDRTDPEDDRKLAGVIEKSLERQTLFATLALIGGTFAVRTLDRYAIHNVDATLKRLDRINEQDQEDLPRALFEPFLDAWRARPCSDHENNPLFCLQQDFRAQLQSKAWLVRVAEFRDGYVLKFSERWNMPFINDERLEISNRSLGREFYRFQIHPDYYDGKAKVRSNHSFSILRTVQE